MEEIFCSDLVTKALRVNLRLWNLTATNESMNLLTLSSFWLSFYCCSSDHRARTYAFFSRSLILEIRKSLFGLGDMGEVVNECFGVVFYLRTRLS